MKQQNPRWDFAQAFFIIKAMVTLFKKLFERAGQEETPEWSAVLKQEVEDLLSSCGDSQRLFHDLKVWSEQTNAWDKPYLAKVWRLLGRVLFGQQCFDASIPFFEESLRCVPDQREAQIGLGFAQFHSAHFEAARQTFERVLKNHPEEFNGWMGLGMTMRRLNLQEEALKAYEVAIRLRPESHEAWTTRGNSLWALKRFKDAYESYEEATRRCSGYIPAILGKVWVLRDNHQPEAARALLAPMIQARTRDPEIRLEWACVCQMLGELAEARQFFQSLVTENPAHFKALQGLGNVAFLQGDVDFAIACYRQTLALQPEALGYHNLGVALTRSRRFQEALSAHEQAIALNPNYQSAHVNHALLWMIQGNLPKGFPEYEWRLNAEPFGKRQIPCSPWQGESLAGRTILIMAEQGFGDAIMYLRFLRPLKDQGATIVFEARPEMMSLLSSCPDIDDLVPWGAWLQAAQKCDYYCYLISLPHLLKITMESLPENLPDQFVVPESRKKIWENRFSAVPEFKIGITWATKADHPNAWMRSTDPGFFAALARQFPARFFSFQKGVVLANTIEEWPTENPVVDLASEINDFADTMAALSSMDLVITVDTALAHAAGSLNIPTWVVLPHECDWRWFLAREDSPWYPTMRLFRQARFGDWDSAFALVHQSLSLELAQLGIDVLDKAKG